MIKLNFLFLFIAALFSAQNVSINKLDRFLDDIENNNQNIGNLSIYKNGRSVYNRSFGQKSVEGLQFNTETKYHIGSVTKLFTSTMIWQLIEEHKIRLDTQLSTYYPGIEKFSGITVKNLLEHTSGLGDYISYENGTSWIDSTRSEADIINRITKQEVLFKPGKSMKYSNSAYYLLSNIIEKERKMSHEKAVKKYILKPQKLDISFAENRRNKNFFGSYEFTDQWNSKKELNFKNAIGVGNLLATPQTLNTFINQLFNYKILKKQSVDAMLPTSDETQFGRGIMYTNYNKKNYYGHGGTTSGTHSMVLYNPDDRISIAYSMNGVQYNSNDFLKIILNIINEKEYVQPKFIKSVLAGEDFLNTITGTYIHQDSGMELKLFTKDKILMGQATDQQAFSLQYLGGNKFFQDSEDINLEFFLQKKELQLTQEDESMVFVKK